LPHYPRRLIYCRDISCSHHTETNADGWADDVRLSDIEDKFVCQVCGRKGGRHQAELQASEDGHRLKTR
jgi:hypothetical protein